MEAGGGKARSNSVSPHWDLSDASLTASGQGRRLSAGHRQGEEKDNKSKDLAPPRPPYLEDLSNSESSAQSVEMEDMSHADLTDDEETGLTEGQRKKRRQQKQDNTRLDQRVAALPLTKTEQSRLADANVVKKLGVNVVLIGLWYLFSLTISIYNKWMFDPKHLDSHFPLFTTSMHMVVQFTLASCVLFFFPRLRPKADPSVAASSPGKPLMSTFFYLTRIAPCGTATGLDIGLGNMSLRYISLTFFTMCKSSALAFVLLFAFVFRLEAPSIKLVLIIATMTAGVVMMVFGEAAFDLSGFILVIMSSFFSGFRWALTQILLLRNPATSNPFASIFFLAPVMFLTLFILAVPVEGFHTLSQGLHDLVEKEGLLWGVLLLLFPGAIAFCMTSAEFALLQRTSVVTLSICGIFKEVVTITAAEVVYHDPLTPINVSGLVVTIASIAAYNYIKIKKMREEAREDVKDRGRTNGENAEEGEAEERRGMLADERD